jgi:signal transduction histidine kinase
LRIAELIADRPRIANIKNNLGNIYLTWGSYNKAFDLYIEALSIYEEIHDSTGISKAYNNIGIIYYDWNEWEKSLQYYLLSFEVDSLIGDTYGQSQTLNNIGIVYDELGQKEKGLRVYRRSLDLAKEIGDNYQIAITTSNIGSFYLESGDFDKTELYYTQTLEEYTKANSIMGIAETDILLGDLYKEKGQYERAIQYYEIGLHKVLAMNLPGVIMTAYHGLGEVAFIMGDYKTAYIYNEEYHRITDSVFNLETSNQLALLTNAYETQKKDQEMELQSVRLSEQKSRIRRQLIAVIALSGTILLTLVFTILLIRQYRLRMKAWNQLIAQHEEILKNRQELIKAKEKAEESDRLKSSFLVNLSHELRTPMNGIMGFTDLLQKGTASEKQQQTYLAYIASSSRQLLKVLNDIIDISAIETGQLEIDHEACDIYTIFSDLHEYFSKEKHELGKESIELILEEPEENDKQIILADNRRLSQIIHNLINNALMFTQEGSVSIGYRIIDKRIVKIHVKDTGIGIERRKFEVIFDRFRQVDDTTTRQHGGSGLGLAISRELVSLMKGRIYLESEVGVGSTFYIEIPYISSKA